MDQAVLLQDEAVQQYMKEIRQYPLLTAQEERQLAMASAQGDEEAIRKLVISNLRLVVHIAREYVGRGVPFLDMIQEGSIGLLIAAGKFDYTLDFRFSTYATKWIRQCISRCILNHSGLIRVPVRAAERIRKIQVAQAQLRQELEKEPDAQQIACRAEMSEDKVREYLALLPELCSLDAVTGDGEDTLQMLLEDVHAPQPQEELIRRELAQQVHTLLEQLTERQRQVVRLRYGMEDGTCYAQSAIGQMLGISKERVRQIESEALAKLQKNSQGLEAFLIDG